MGFKFWGHPVMFRLSGLHFLVHNTTTRNTPALRVNTKTRRCLLFLSVPLSAGRVSRRALLEHRTREALHGRFTVCTCGWNGCDFRACRFSCAVCAQGTIVIYNDAQLPWLWYVFESSFVQRLVYTTTDERESSPLYVSEEHLLIWADM